MRLTTFYKKYADSLPMSLPTLRNFVNDNEVLKDFILTMSAGTRKSYIVQDVEGLLRFFAKREKN